MASYNVDSDPRNNNRSHTQKAGEKVMADILTFGEKPKEERPTKLGKDLATWVWTCNACGNSTFQMLQGGELRCACCNLTCNERRHFDPKER